MFREEREHGWPPVPACDMKQLHALVGFPDVWDFEQKHVEVK